MTTKRQRRLIMLALLLGGPIAGVIVNGDRGLLFGLIVSLLAIIWFIVEERKLL